jgi:hypothetical protein
MRIVLCHNCWSWVQLEGDQCPDCHRAMDLSEPDPSSAELDALLGSLVCRLAKVRCDRRKLPSVGELVAVTEGLLFLPEVTPLPNGALEAEEHPSSSFWPISNWWSNWGRRLPAVDPPRPDVLIDAAPLAEQFLNAPGAVFVPRRHLIRAALRGRVWTISRSVGRTLRFTATDPAEDARRSWQSMLTRDPAWRKLTNVG